MPSTQPQPALQLQMTPLEPTNKTAPTAYQAQEVCLLPIDRVFFTLV